MVLRGCDQREKSLISMMWMRVFGGNDGFFFCSRNFDRGFFFRIRFFGVNEKKVKTSVELKAMVLSVFLWVLL